jgi:hypothetical protein
MPPEVCKPPPKRLPRDSSCSRVGAHTGQRCGSLAQRRSKACRLLASAQSDQAAGHWRAISRGVVGSMTVTSGTLDAQVRAVSDPDRSDSQADSAGSIPVTRSHVRAGWRAGVAAKDDLRDLLWSLVCHWRAIAGVAPVVGMLGSALPEAVPAARRHACPPHG